MKIFISYSSRDADTAAKVSDFLQKHGHCTFFDRERVKPGDDIVSSIGKGISESDAVIFLLNNQILRSQWITTELSLALSERKRIVPIVLGKDVSLPFFLKRISHISVPDLEALDSALNELEPALASVQDTVSEARFQEKAIEGQKAFLDLQKEMFEKELDSKNKKLQVMSAVLSTAGAAATVLAGTAFVGITSPITAGLLGLVLGGAACGLAPSILGKVLSQRDISVDPGREHNE